MRLSVTIGLTVPVLAAFSPGYAGSASSFAGETTSFVFPDSSIATTPASSFFPNPSQVGHAGPTAVGDEAEAVATTPAMSPLDNIYPLVRPKAYKQTNPNFDVLAHLGNLSPLQSVKSFGLPGASPQVPDTCRLNQVHLLYRHGARFPSTSFVNPFTRALHTAAQHNPPFNASGNLEFLNTWKYKLGAESLTEFGRSEIFSLGVGFRIKYGELLKGFNHLPVWRTTSQARMVDSALHFAAGFFGVRDYSSSYRQVIEIEDRGISFNSTLGSTGACPNFNKYPQISGYGNNKSEEWADIYLRDTVQRIQKDITGFNVTVDTLLIWQQLCAYETVALGYSTFCTLFTEEEWEGFEYWNDLKFWYSYGPGNPLTSSLGLGWVQELVSRLTKTTITVFNSSVNQAIVNNTALFPFDQPIYADATHEIMTIGVLTAMNFTGLAGDRPLPTDEIPTWHTWHVNDIAPFATNLVGQVLACPTPADPHNTTSTHIRWILNDAVLPLTGLQGCVWNQDGLCPLDTFITAVQKRIRDIDFNYDCRANYTIPEPDNIVNGSYPRYIH